VKQVTLKGDRTSACKILVLKPKRKRFLGIIRPKLESTIKMNPKEMG
jgi:hypothetical protein